MIDEARWLRGKFYDDDFVNFWMRGTGHDTVAYTDWIIDAVLGKSQVDGNVPFLISQLHGMMETWNRWYFTFDASFGLYHINLLRIPRNSTWEGMGQVMVG